MRGDEEQVNRDVVRAKTLLVLLGQWAGDWKVLGTRRLESLRYVERQNIGQSGDPFHVARWQSSDMGRLPVPPKTKKFQGELRKGERCALVG